MDIMKKVEEKENLEMKIAIVGLGKIGSSLMACFAHRQFQVWGIDLDKNIVDQINNGKAPFPETNLDLLIKNNKERIKATTKMIEAIPYTDLAFIRVATPSTPNGSFSSEYVKTAALEIARCIPDDKKEYIIVNTSTVMPGTMNEVTKLVQQVNQNIGVCYMPDFVALGTVIQDYLNPDFIIIGESSKKAGDILSKVLVDLTDRRAFAFPYFQLLHRMEFYNAEIAKLAFNNYMSMKISFTNTISEICEKIPEGDAEKVLSAIGHSSRISNKFLKPGLGYGGFCFTRDQRAFINYAISQGVKPHLANATDRVNDNVAKRISIKLKRKMEKLETDKIGILGVTYKTDVPYTEESTVLKIIHNLINIPNIEVSAYDPALHKHPYCETIEECLQDQKLIFIGTPWKQFRDIDHKIFKNKTVIDSFGILKTLEKESDIDYIRIGTNKFNLDLEIT